MASADGFPNRRVLRDRLLEKTLGLLHASALMKQHLEGGTPPPRLFQRDAGQEAVTDGFIGYVNH